MKRLSTCCAIRLHDPAAPIGALSAWGTRNKLWPRKAKLRVRFMSGNSKQQAEAWKRFQLVDGLVNLSFVKARSGENAEIRVKFTRGAGHWSYVGIDNRTIPQRSQTMNIELTAGMFGDSQEEWDRVATHEILHAIGLQHEHQHPEAAIQWDEAKVIAYYKRTQGWTEQEIRFQVLNRAPMTADAIMTRFDPTSIMEYPVDAALTRNGFSVGWNSHLSMLDKEFLKRIYP